MKKDAYTPITKGYDFIRAGNYEAAEMEFRAALKADRFNPFALNNLAVLSEKKGKLKEALAFLIDAQTHAAEYNDKVQQTCFIDGLCQAVKPVQEVGPKSVIAEIIAENMAKLKDKIAKTPMPPEPSSPPPVSPKR
jgi:Flp pilus assembly protein TadD